LILEYLNRSKNIALVAANNAVTKTPPLGLLCLSAALKKHGYQVDVFDFSISKNREPELFESIARAKYLWVGFSSITPSLHLIEKYIERSRMARKEIPILLGGVHASVLPEQTLRDLPIDAVCIGPGESAVVKFSELVASGRTDYWQVPELAALDGKGAFRQSGRPLQNLTAPSRPDWSKVNLGEYSKYPPLQYIRRRKIVAPIYTTRGCPFDCAFCAVHATSSHKLLHRPPIDVVDEIEYLYQEKGAEEIHIVDDNFNYNLKYAKQVLTLLAERNLPIVWKTPNGLWIHSYDREWLDLCRRTGCYQVGFGIESGSAEVLKTVGKKIRLAEVKQAVSAYREAGISTFGFFILGLPGETRQQIEQTIRFACDLPLDHVAVDLFMPYPGSRLFREAIAAGTFDNDWRHYHHYGGFRNGEMYVGELMRAMRRFYLRFYARPERAFNLLRDVRSSGLLQFRRVVKNYFFLSRSEIEKD
jgi:radical SAM superfamily enzyme YgiQ (UPF0313 family)